jgi:hypothetical protein
LKYQGKLSQRRRNVGQSTFRRRFGLPQTGL